MPYKNKEDRNARRRALTAERRAALGHAAPPLGYAPVSVTTDGDGAVRAVRSIPEGDEPHQPLVLEGHQIRFVTSLLDSAGNVKLQYVRGERSSEDRYAAALAAVDRHFEELGGRWANMLDQTHLQHERTAPAAVANDLQVTLLMGDPHIGMLSWHLETGTDFDLRIAEKQLLCAVDMLIARAPAAERLVVANLGDFFHAEDDSQKTPRGGNKLDVDGRSGKVLDIGFSCLERVILRGLEKYPSVVVVNLPGNHDPRLARVLSRWLTARFRAETRVEILSNDDPFTFVSWGENLHMYCHGDGAKPEALPAIMASWAEGKPWGAHRHRMIYTGHIHHLQRREYPGVVWESSRTMAPSDYWHHHSGYRAGRGMRAVTHHREHGHVREDLIGAREVELAL
jgi:hypothetical protein